MNTPPGASGGRQPLRILAISLAVLTCSSATAAELVNDDTKSIRWDNSVKYTLGARATDPSAHYLRDPNTNDGDAAFGRRGKPMTNRIDWLSEFDATWKDAHSSGVRFSAAGWYDSVYRRSHDAVPAATYNPVSVPNTQFNGHARRWAGANAEVYDAFLHSGFDVGDMRASWRLGRHTMTWGESLLLATNGISGAQAPADVYKSLTVPGLQAKDFLMPVNQLSGSLGLNERWSLQGYYQLEYRATRLAAPGTYFSPSDVVFDGAERLMLAPGMGIPREASQKPPDARDQWGVSALYRNAETGWDIGGYYLRYTAKTPQVYMRLAGIPVAPFVVPGSYYFTYPQQIEALGLSAATHVGDASAAGEISLRNNMPLVSDRSALVVPPGMQPGSGDPLYAVGRTLHYQASTIWVVPRNALWETANLVAEVGGNTLLSVTRNPDARDRNTSRTTFGMAVQFEPGWYQARPDLDISLPITLAYNFNKKASAVDPGFNGTGAARGGSVSVGLKFTYSNAVKGALHYTKFLGSDANNPLGDRDFLTFNLNYSF